MTDASARNMKLDHVLDALRGGAVLHLSLADKPTWKLTGGIAEATVSSSIIAAALKRQAIVGAGDSLFADIPSQTWRIAP